MCIECSYDRVEMPTRDRCCEGNNRARTQNLDTTLNAVCNDEQINIAMEHRPACMGKRTADTAPLTNLQVQARWASAVR